MIATGDINQSDENLTHFGGVRIRVNGSGNLIPTFYSLDQIQSQTVRSFSMEETTAREKFNLANFTSQRGYLKLETTEIDEIFRINRVIVYVKPMYSQFVGE